MTTTTAAPTEVEVDPFAGIGDEPADLLDVADLVAHLKAGTGPFAEGR